MNWDAIGAIGEMIGAAAVIASLIYVAVQIRQNTAESKTLRTQNLVSVNSEVTAHIASNAELSKIIRSGMLDYEALSLDERFQFNLIFYSIYNQWDFAYHQYLAGLLDETFFQKINYEIPTYTTLPGMRIWWEGDKSRMSKEFVEYVEKRMSESAAMEDYIPTLGRTEVKDGT